MRCFSIYKPVFWFHLIVGVLMFVVFVTTGKFMRIDFLGSCVF
ncbi:MAG: hypothetical protein ABI481_03085 [Pyrinomonadaceae bacterium]